MSLLGGSAPMYGLKLPARTLCSVGNGNHNANDTDATSTATPAAGISGAHIFLVGTCSAKEENELQVLEFDEEENEIRAKAVYTHAQEIWQVSACPHDASICATTYPVDSTTYQATVWRIPSLAATASSSNGDPAPSPSSTSSASGGGGNHPTMQRLFDLKGHQGRVKGVVWNAGVDEDQQRSLLTIDQQCVRVWEMNASSTELKTPTATLTSPVQGGPNAAAWDPHHARQLLSADSGNLRQYDLRSGVSPVSSIEHAHEDEIRDVDYNPNKPFHVLSAGCDRRVRIWDLRSPGTPLKVLQGHSHWTCMARFNRFHDQLLLSAGTERVNLWNILSLSSAPIGELEQSATDKTGAPAAQDSLIKTFSDHEDSINAVAWSSHDAWIFASLSYDGRVVVNHVPPAEKYRILL